MRSLLIAALGFSLGTTAAAQIALNPEPASCTAPIPAQQTCSDGTVGGGAPEEFGYIQDSLPCLHPGRSARITRCGKSIGWIGELHPQLVQEFDFTYAPILFEIEYQPALVAKMPRFEEISRFPRVRRDLAVVVDEKVSLRQLHDRVTFAASSLLRDIRVFDVFRGPGIESGRKSVALGLIFQDNSRTLADEDADRLLAAIRADLSATLGAGFRE
jgi:phenylalanyl-tRNA synthetase beta chain